jgi:hypothetical protein
MSALVRADTPTRTRAVHYEIRLISPEYSWYLLRGEKRPISAAVPGTGKSIRFSAHGSVHQIAIRIGGMRPWSVRADQTPGNRRQNSNHCRERSMPAARARISKLAAGPYCWPPAAECTGPLTPVEQRVGGVDAVAEIRLDVVGCVLRRKLGRGASRLSQLQFGARRQPEAAARRSTASSNDGSGLMMPPILRSRGKARAPSSPM